MDNKKINQLMMELYANLELKEEFVKNPKKIMEEKGIEVSENIELKVVEETENTKYIVLPFVENEDQLSQIFEKKNSKAIGMY